MATPSPESIPQERLDRLAEILNNRLFAVDQPSATALLSDSFDVALSRATSFRTDVLEKTLAWDSPPDWKPLARQEASRAWGRMVRAALGKLVDEGKFWKAKLNLRVPRNPATPYGPLYYWANRNSFNPFLAPFREPQTVPPYRYPYMRYGGAGFCDDHPISRLGSYSYLEPSDPYELGPDLVGCDWDIDGHVKTLDYLNPKLPTHFWDEAARRMATRYSEETAIAPIVLYGSNADSGPSALDLYRTTLTPTGSDEFNNRHWPLIPDLRSKDFSSWFKTQEADVESENVPTELTKFQEALCIGLRIGYYLRSLPYHEPRLDLMRFWRNDDFLVSESGNPPIGYFYFSQRHCWAVYSGHGCDATKLELIHRDFVDNYRRITRIPQPYPNWLPGGMAYCTGYAVF